MKPVLLPLLLCLAACSGAAPAGEPDAGKQCVPAMADPEAVTGWLGGEVSTAKVSVRTDDNAIGQLAAEAFYLAFDGIFPAGSDRRPDLAFEIAANVRPEGRCESHDPLHAGPLRRKVLREVLPFEADVAVVTLTHFQLKNALEHAVAHLSPAGSVAPSGSFLQLHGAAVTADCKLPGELLRTDGTRSHQGRRITRVALVRRDGTSVEIPLDPPSDTQEVRVAVTSELLEGYAGNLDLAEARDPTLAGSGAFETVAAHFKAAYPESSPLPAEPADRWQLIDCR